jgi:hypothetical protein
MNMINNELPLEPLPYPVYFVCRNTKAWHDLMTGVYPPSADEIYGRFLDLTDCWSVLTYVHLKRRGLNVHLVPHFVPGEICIIAYDELAIKDLPFTSYVICCRCDRGRPEICDRRIVQNSLNIVNATDHLLPHWPQPNLQPRILTRGTTIKTIVFKGFLWNLAKSFRSPEFMQQLQDLGVELQVSSADLGERVCDDWIDYTQADLVLAVRDCTEYNLAFKPASKLVNAWMAGSPALLGPEPAYRSLWRSELDYIEVCSPGDVLEAIRRLQHEPSLYTAMVENGFQRAKEFTPDYIASLWRDLLAGPIAENYEQWLHQSQIQKLIGRPIQFVHRSIKHKQAIHEFRKKIDVGFRPVPQ